ncbi:hypothetical protein DFW101_3479 [Solidesulfovibrio carbinoliphilus subsp. oakridgensis]|uniref:Uncharacterized protein n=1 Tax=Solidesulfovibrio carbinoliphilus subsp. oakridgensis TaxID=694327 RepID=G7QC31_9BACT|nr:hypothetical protein [Solidesulfovibrio carbinoliphilus]EHJ49477.1 hypothetical protein DFW101_3479 [Solidesulfovibrio carbinoliphilus subsp. oakridgensis]
MFAPTVHVECVSVFEPVQGVWQGGDVNPLTEEDAAVRREADDEDFLDFCRRSLG